MDGLRKRINNVVGLGVLGDNSFREIADAVLEEIAKDAVIVEKDRWERVRTYAASHERYVEDRWDMMGPSELKRGDLDPLP